MATNGYIEINVLVKGKIKPVKMQAGTSFENKSKVYTVKKDGKLSIFDKKTSTTQTAVNIEMTNYQYNTFCAIADNNDEQKGEIILSRKDIYDAIMMSKKDLTKDLTQNLKGYQVHKPESIPKENRLSVYITNGIKYQSGYLGFKYNPIPKPALKGAFTGNYIFNNENIEQKKSGIYTVKENQDIVSIARIFEVEPYQILAANPQLKEGEDYNIRYISEGTSAGTAQIDSYLEKGQKIRIPARYNIKNSSLNSLEDVAEVTGTSISYIRDVLTKTEANGPKLKDKYLTTYPDPTGIPTIAYGHTGRVDGKPLSLKHPITITKQEAYELLANDILKHKANLMAYLGENNYKRAPKSIQDALLDISYNKGIINGFMHTGGYCEETSKVKNELALGQYVSALTHTRRTKTGFAGLHKRNLYRFVTGLRDLTPGQRKRAISGMESYYQEVLKMRKGKYDEKSIKKLWNNAKEGKLTNIEVK